MNYEVAAITEKNNCYYKLWIIDKFKDASKYIVALREAPGTSRRDYWPEKLGSVVHHTRVIVRIFHSGVDSCVLFKVIQKTCELKKQADMVMETSFCVMKRVYALLRQPERMYINHLHIEPYVKYCPFFH